MLEKPPYLGIEFASRFQDRSVAGAYHLRPPYAEEVFTILEGLITDEPCAVLDVGCGTGDVARRLVGRVQRVDAVDVSSQMIEHGKRQPGGDAPGLRWIVGRAEDTALQPPYALITAGESLHWMDWNVVLPRFAKMLTPHGYLAVVGRDMDEKLWNSAFTEIIRRYSTNKHYKPFNMIVAFEQYGLFRTEGVRRTASVPFVQALDDYIESFHSRSSFSREHMGDEQARAFDDELRTFLGQYARDGLVTLSVYSKVVWGKPMNP